MLALYYREYIRGGAKRWITLVRILSIGFSLVLFFYAFYIVYSIVRNPILYYATVMLMIAALLVHRVKESGYDCKKEEEREINGVRHVVCYTDIANAWYNRKTRKIYVSGKLAERLTDDEIKAVVYHEEGHARNKWLNWVSSLLFALWVFILAGIMLILAILWRTPLPASQSLIGISTMYAIASIITLSAMIPSWIAEHESDRRALEATSLESIVNALVKVHIYGKLGRDRLLEAVGRCEIKGAGHLLGAYQKVPFAPIFLILLWYSFTFPKWIGEYLQKPVYYTHPPVQLRLALLLHHSSTARKTKDEEST
jgi:Zn-dependent protease with chaperone function